MAASFRSPAACARALVRELRPYDGRLAARVRREVRAKLATGRKSGKAS